MIKRILSLPVLLALILIVSCKNREREQAAPAIPPTVEDSISTLNINADNFTEIDSGFVMFQLTMNELEIRKKDYYKEIPSNTYWNMLFYNSHTGSTHLLTEDKILIDNFWLSNADSYNEPTQKPLRYIFFTGRKEDYNHDGLLTNLDPSQLFACDKDGKNFIQVSPVGHELSNWKYLESSGKVVMTVRADSNRDSVFEHIEETQVFEKDMKSANPPQPSFNPFFIDSLKLKFGRYWHRKK